MKHLRVLRFDYTEMDVDQLTIHQKPKGSISHWQHKQKHISHTYCVQTLRKCSVSDRMIVETNQTKTHNFTHSFEQLKAFIFH